MSPRLSRTAPPQEIVRQRLAMVQRGFDAWRANRLHSVADDMDPAVEVDWTESRAPYRGIYVGRTAWLQLFAEMRSSFEAASSVPHDLVVTSHHVVVPNTVHMRGRYGIEVVAESTLVFGFEGSQVVSLRLHQCNADALAALAVP